MMRIVFLSLLIAGCRGVDVTCPSVASSLDTALRIHGKTGTQLLAYADDVAKKMDLANILDPSTLLTTAELQALPDQEIIDLASLVMFGQVNNLTSVWAGLSPVEIRVAVERLGLSLNPGISTELEERVGLLSTQQVLLLACGVDSWFVEHPRSTGVLSGCYSGTVLGTDTAKPLTSPNCLAECRTQSFYFSGLVGGTCRCSSSLESLGTRTGSPVNGACSNGADTNILLTGIGLPTVGAADPLRVADPKLPEFKPLDLDGVDITDNILIGIREIKFPLSEGSSAGTVYIVAVYTFSAVLFKVNTEGYGRGSYEYVTHKRWDGSNDNGAPAFIRDFLPEQFASTAPRRFQKAVAFDIAPIFITVNGSLAVDPGTNLAGVPLPGGAWYQHLIIFHEDSDLTAADRNLPKVTAIRLVNKGLDPLTYAKTADDYGYFTPTHLPLKNPVTITVRLFGRRAFCFVGTSNSARGTGAVEGFELKEVIRSLPGGVGSVFSQVRMERLTTATLPLLANNVAGIEVVDFFVHGYMVVVDRTVFNGLHSRIRVYKNSKDLELNIIDEKIFENVIFTDVKFVRIQMNGFLFLTTATGSYLLSVTRKGFLAGDLKAVTENLPGIIIPYTYGSLEDNILFPSLRHGGKVTHLQFWTEEGTELASYGQNLNLAVDRAYKGLICMRPSGGHICVAASSVGMFKLDIFSVHLIIELQVDDKLIQMAELDTVEARILGRVGNLQAQYQVHKAKTAEILLNSGSVLQGNWKLGTVKVGENFSLPTGSLENTQVTIELNRSDSSVSTFNYRDGMNVLLSQVDAEISKINAGFEAAKTIGRTAFKLNSPEVQIIPSIALGKLTADKIFFKGTNPVLQIESILQGSVVESLDTLKGDLYLHNTNAPMTGSKAFINSFQADSLRTGSLSDNLKTVSSANLLKNKGDLTVNAHQQFINAISMSKLEVGATVPLTDAESPPSSVTVDDIRNNNLFFSSGINGHYLFENIVTTTDITYGMSDLNHVQLSSLDASRIVKKDENAIINGSLTVQIHGTGEATGKMINIENGIVSGVNLKELNKNAAKIRCLLPCEEHPVQFSANVTFGGKVTFNSSFNVNELNTIPLVDYVQKDALLDDLIVIAGDKSLSNSVHANSSFSTSYNGLTLDQLITQTTAQVITGSNVFQNIVTFDSIEGADDFSGPSVDGRNLWEVFSSDLMAVRDQKPWIKNKTLGSSLILDSVVLTPTSTLNVKDQINNMDVAATLKKIVLDDEGSVTLTGNYTFLSDINLNTVFANNIAKGNKMFTIDEFANTVTTEVINGEKTFTGVITFGDMFLVDNAQINNLNFYKIITCWVDIGSETTGPVEILNPIKLQRLRTPSLLVKRDPALVNSVCPKDISLLSAVKLIQAFPLNPVPSNDILKLALISSLQNIGLAVQDDAELPINSMFAFLLNLHSNGNLTTAVINELTVAEKRHELLLLIRQIFGLSSAIVNTYTDLHAVQALCRNPKLNNLDPATDLAILNRDNTFCSANTMCMQHFANGLTVKAVDVTGKIVLNAGHTVFGVDVDTLNSGRASLSASNQQWNGDYTLRDLRMSETGVFTGQLMVNHNGVNVSSLVYKDRFLNVNNCAVPQIFTETRQVPGLGATEVSAAILKVNNTDINLPDLNQNALPVNAPVDIDSLAFTGNVVLVQNTVLDGLLDGVNLTALTSSIIVHGESQTVNGAEITGTNAPFIHFTSPHMVQVAPVAASVVPWVDTVDGTVYPQVAFKSCTRTLPVDGLVNGTTLKTSVAATIEDCARQCRMLECVALSYRSSPQACELFSNYNAVIPSVGYTSIIYDCFFQIKSSSSSLFLSADLATNNLIMRREPDFWRSDKNLLIHKFSGLAVSINPSLQTGDAVTLAAPDHDSPSQQGSFVIADPTTSTYKIVNVASGLALTESGSGSGLVQENAAVSTTTWTAGYGSINFNQLVDGALVPTVLSSSLPQSMRGILEVVGSATLSGPVVSDTLGGINVSRVAEIYTYTQATDTHQVKTDLDLVGEVSITDLKTSLVGGRVLQDFFSDAVLRTSGAEQIVAGTKQFSSVLEIGSPSLQVSGLVDGFDLSSEFGSTAMIGSDAVFTELNTFTQNELGTNTVTVLNSVTADTAVTVVHPVIENGVDLDNLVQNTIPIGADGTTVDVRGTVQFTKDLTSGGDLSLGPVTSPETAPEQINIPGDLIQTSAVSMTTTFDGVDRVFSEVKSIRDIELHGQIFGHDVDTFTKVLYLQGDQTITGDWKFNSELTLSSDTEVSGLVNGVSLPDNLVFLDANTTFVENVQFSDSLTVQEVSVSGMVNGLDINVMDANVFTLDTQQTISEHWNFVSDTEFHKNVVGNGLGEDGEGLINDQPVLDIIAASAIYDKMAAVKISAQAEAATLCNNVASVQETYLSNQWIKQYDVVATYSPTSPPLKGAKLVWAATVGRLFLVTRDGADLIVSEQSGAQFNPVASIAVQETGLSHVSEYVDVTVSGSTEYNIVLFLTTGMAGTGTFMYRLSGTANTVQLQQVGALTDVRAVHRVGQNSILGLKYVENSGAFSSRVLVYDPAGLVDCTDCSLVPSTEVWDGSTTASWSTVPPAFNPAIDVLEIHSNKYIVALTETIQAIGGPSVRILDVTRSVSMTGQAMFAGRSSVVVVVGAVDYSLLYVHSRVHLVVGGTNLLMYQVNLDTDTMKTVAVAGITGSVTGIQRQKNFLGDLNTLTGVQDDSTFVFLEFAGVEGLAVKKMIRSNQMITSASGISFIDGTKASQSFLVVTEETRTRVLKGLINNPVAQVEFTCVPPEVDIALISTP